MQFHVYLSDKCYQLSPGQEHNRYMISFHLHAVVTWNKCVWWG